MDHAQFSYLLQAQTRKNNKILNASIELLTQCNCACIHCYHNEHQNSGPSYQQCLYIIDELQKEGVLDIQLTGGEIFLRKDLLSIVEYIFNAHISVELFTNATLITNPIARKLQRKIKGCFVSIYGTTKKTYEAITRAPGSFAQFTNGIQALLLNDIPLRFNVVVLNENYHEVDDMIAFCCKCLNCPPTDSRIRVSYNVLPQKNGCDDNVTHAISGERYLSGVKKLYWGKALPSYAEIKAFTPDLNVAPCRAGNWSINVAANGDVTPCISFPLSFGNIFSQNLNDILNSKQAIAHRKINIADLKGCSRCEYVNFCSICFGQLYTQAKIYGCNQESDLCRQTKEFVNLLKREEKL